MIKKTIDQMFEVRIFYFALLLLAPAVAYTQTVKQGIYYGPEDGTAYQQEMCKLDIYQPEDQSRPSPVVIYFHGGGLYLGQREGPIMTQAGIMIVAPSYRLHPKAKHPDYLEDAADAVAWTFENIADYGGDPDNIYLSGISAGAYLSSMMAMDKSWLGARGVDADKLAGLIAVSGQMITHFTIRKEMGLGGETGLADKYSPLYHIRKTPFPILIQCGDDDYPSRQEENRLFVSMMLRYAKQAANSITYREYPGTHYNFFSAKPQQDMQQYILEKSGLAESSGRFEATLVKPKAELQVYARDYEDKTYFELKSNIAGFDSVDVDLPSGEVIAIDTEHEAAVVGKEPVQSGVSEIRLTKQAPVEVIRSLSEVVLPQGESAAVTSKMKAGSDLKFWTENHHLNIQIVAKDDAIFGSHTKNLWSGDALEVFVDRTPFLALGQNDYPIKGKDGEVRQYIFGVKPASDGSQVALFANKEVSTTAATVEVEFIEGAYQLTASIPLAEISPLAEPERAIGIAIQRCIKDQADQGKQGNEFWTFGVSGQYRRMQYTLFTIEALRGPML